MPRPKITEWRGVLFRRQLQAVLDWLEFELGRTQFSESLTAKRTPTIELNSAYGTTALRDVETVSNSATITAALSGEILLSTGATASSTARLDSAERVRYVPGYGAQFGIGIRIPTAPTGNQEAKWGLRNPAGTEGIYFGVDATGFYVATLRNSTETVVRPASFSIDKLDGVGESKTTLDLTAGNIFQANYTWYGYGVIEFSVVTQVNGKQQVVPFHAARITGTTSVQSPNLPVFVEATNGGDAADFDVYVGGRQASIIGDYNPKFRVTAQERTGVTTGTTAVPLVSFRNKTNFQDRSIAIDSAVASVATNDHVIEFYLNPTLTGASWTTPANATAAETSLETDVSASALSGGTLVFSYYAPAGAAQRENATESLARFDIPENQIITMAARTVTSTGTATGYFRIREEW